jgi:hypothetical protein
MTIGGENDINMTACLGNGYDGEMEVLFLPIEKLLAQK